MKLLLLQPPVQDFYDTDIRLQPLGLCMLKAAVKKFLPHVEVQVRDYHQGLGRRTIAYPAELAYLRDYYCHADRSPFSTFHHYYHFGASFEEIGEDVAAKRPDLVGISSLFSPYHREALACAREIKRRIDVPILMGGSHVSACPLRVLDHPDVDFIIRGEGERPLVEFLRAFESDRRYANIPNLGFKEDGRLTVNPLGRNYVLRDLPFADLSDLEPGRYLYDGAPLCFLTATRGCPHRCAFCSVHLTFGGEFRRRRSEHVLSEIKARYEKGYRVFDFEDDNLTFHKEDFTKLLNGLINEFDHKDVRFFAMNGLSYLSLDREILTLMRRAGFQNLNLSLVSAQGRVLEKAARPHTLAKYLEIVDLAYSLGFRVVSYQILGLPYETLDDMIGTMALMASLPVLIGASIFYLTPGSPIASEFSEPTEEDIFKSRSTAMAVETDHFGREDIYTLFMTARIINFIKRLHCQTDKTPLHDAIRTLRATGERDRLGFDLLTRLFEEGRLHAATRSGFKELPRFKTDLFLKILKKAGSIRTRRGVTIDVGDSQPLQRP
jgi:radical SAM superfamily enzyme YgiQ (UPF0313 family)